MIYVFTDYGFDGPYAGLMRAVLARDAPRVPVIDLMHDAPLRDPRRSAYLLAALAAEMQPGSICLAVIDPGVGGERPGIVVSAGERYFVGPGNGLFEIVQRRADRPAAWRIDWRPERLSASFHGRDIFAPVAAMIAKNEWSACSAMEQEWREDRKRPGADWPDDLAEAIYIDGFGNVMTGLRADDIRRSATVEVSGRLLASARTFGDVAEGDGFWYENSLGLVEIAVNHGNAAQQYGIKPGAPVSLRN